MRRRDDTRPAAARRRGEQGFTLLEVLVALVVLGFLLAGLSQGTRFGVRAWDTQARIGARADDLDGADRLLRALIAAARPPASSDEHYFTGDTHRLLFITTLPDEPPTALVRRAEVSLGVDERHRLVLRWVLKPHAVPLVPDPPPGEVVLASGVDHVDLAYGERGRPGWQRTWRLSALPGLVRVRVVFLDGEWRHWPDIIAATMLDALRDS